MTRAEILAATKLNVFGKREHDYGKLEDSFGLIAKLWTVYIGCSINAVDVAVMMALLKIARLTVNPQHMDSWVDLAGYAACGGEIAGEEAQT